MNTLLPRRLDTRTLAGATLEANGSCVMLKITTGLVPGDNESVTVSNVVSTGGCGAAMTDPETRNFYYGVVPITTLRAPDPDSLLEVPCQDRSIFSGVVSPDWSNLTLDHVRAFLTTSDAEGRWLFGRQLLNSVVVSTLGVTEKSMPLSPITSMRSSSA